MKGMQKIKRGKQFAGVVLYSLKSASHHKITPYVIGGNMTGSTAAELISEFEGTRLLRPDVAKPVWHNSLRLPKGECLSTRQWAAFADDYIWHEWDSLTRTFAVISFTTMPTGSIFISLQVVLT
ncbi:hypothetical protein JYZ60_003712 [Salmonella enterica subsp. enterica serovar Newport]|nr:hypothetical protein [Salmonella enterica]EHC9819314.1 hypothetical protein [Salmonella enterica subsp. enterica serovar Newport]